jgi:hypothetical protein
MRTYLSFFLFAAAMLSGCTGNKKTGLWQNDKIDPDTKSTIAALNKEVFKCMATNDYQHLVQLFSDSLKDAIKPDFDGEFMPRMEKLLAGRKYRRFDEFYIKNEYPFVPINLTAGSGDSSYFFEIKSLTKDTYISMLVSVDSFNEVMLTLVYGNFDGKWKIDILRGDNYSLFGKNAVAHYKYAEAMMNSGDLVDAVSTMALAERCVKPCGDYFTYKNAGEIKKFSDTLVKQAKEKFPFPYLVTLSKTKVLLFNMHYEFINGHMAPMLMYQTDVNVKDLAALKTENEDFQKNIGTIFPGVDKNNRNIIYRAFNVQPDGKNDPPYYGFVQEIGN